ncbi:MAG: hypothetical protein ACE141_14205 [Bryobacteraceae bacterium]
MHFRRLASLALGGWLAGCALLLALTGQNIRAVDSLIRTPARTAVESMVKMQEADVRILMNYHADSVNQWAYDVWEIAQLFLGPAVLLGLFLSAGSKRYIMIPCLLMIGLVVFQHWFASPQRNRLAATAVFVQPDQVSVERDRLRSIETAYTTMEGIKLGVGFLLAWGLLKRGRRRRESDID